jgi:RNA polymerase sigma factor (sigma-70 family)
MRDAGTTTLQACLDRICVGDVSARADLLAYSQERIRRLTMRVLRSFPKVRRWESGDDLFQEVQIRLFNALKDVSVNSVLDYVRLASWHIRNVLIDLTRKYWGPQGVGTKHATPDEDSDVWAIRSTPAELDDPAKLAVWAEVHETIQRMPDEFRTVFDLLWYHGLAHDEAAEILEVSISTVQRRWMAARLWLRRSFRGELPV